MMPEPALSAAEEADGTAAKAVSPAHTRYLNALLAAMLLTLHGAIAWGMDEWWARGLLLSHFGLFLIWQPVWRGERRMPAALALLVFSVGALFAMAGNWWLIGSWMAVLFGLIGGSVPGRARRNDRLVAVLAAGYLIAMLLMWVVPQVFSHYAMTPWMDQFVRYGLLALPLVILAIPGGERLRGDPGMVDLFYSVILFLLLVALALGSFVIREVSGGEYLFALAQTLIVISLVLFGLSWLWNPRAGFSGLGTLVSQYLLGLGLPFEQRLRRLAEFAQHETRPEQFLRDALTDLLGLPWVTGFAWTAQQSEGLVGSSAAHAEHYAADDLQLTLFAPRPFSPAVLLHLKLLMQMVGYFYGTLRREQLRRQSAYTQAIHETGARLTHDVKNLLQSLRSICAAAEMRGSGDDMAFRALVQRQLPQITLRLNATLEKLKTPERVDSSEMEAVLWWQSLQTRYGGRPVVFQAAEDLQDVRVPVELFDSTADTLIENALYKAARDGAVRIEVFLHAGPRLCVCDGGTPVPSALIADLLRAPVPSDTGLGVGLFQVAQFAAQSGYRLALAENRGGRVCFELGRAATG